MKKPGFIEGVGVALVMSIAGSAVYAALSQLFPRLTVLYLLIPGIALVYLLYLLSRSRQRTGRMTVLSVWLLAALVLWVLDPPFGFYLLMHIGLIWGVRSLYFHSGVLTAGSDFGLSGMALAGAIWAMLTTGSIFAALWCFFLVQAMFVLIPEGFGKSQARTIRDGNDSSAKFDRARRTAESAVQRLITIK